MTWKVHSGSSSAYLGYVYMSRLSSKGQGHVSFYHVHGCPAFDNYLILLFFFVHQHQSATSPRVQYWLTSQNSSWLSSCHYQLCYRERCDHSQLSTSDRWLIWKLFLSLCACFSPLLGDIAKNTVKYRNTLNCHEENRKKFIGLTSCTEPSTKCILRLHFLNFSFSICLERYLLTHRNHVKEPTVRTHSMVAFVNDVKRSTVAWSLSTRASRLPFRLQWRRTVRETRLQFAVCKHSSYQRCTWSHAGFYFQEWAIRWAIRWAIQGSEGRKSPSGVSGVQILGAFKQTRVVWCQ